MTIFCFQNTLKQPNLSPFARKYIFVLKKRVARGEDMILQDETKQRNMESEAFTTRDLNLQNKIAPITPGVVH